MQSGPGGNPMFSRYGVVPTSPYGALVMIGFGTLLLLEVTIGNSPERQELETLINDA
jgi:hypothetical protein